VVGVGVAVPLAAASWTRRCASGGATVPAGLGIQFTEGLAGDLERWRAGYEAFAQTVLGAGAPAATA
jgi:hypothetical protein